jgi:hypothetical protein
MRSVPYLLLVAAVSGCGSAKPYETAAVSGRVMLNGKPLAGARVTFQPQHDPRQGPLSGPESHGITDAEGNYTLTTVFQDKGAAVGRHRVMISTRRLERPANSPEGPLREVAPERVPNKYFSEKVPLYFEVPAKGTDAANFDLISP